jgi:putrescine transport system ATP-binding protein
MDMQAPIPELMTPPDQPWLSATERPFIEIRNVSKSFGAFSALQDVNLKIYKGELFSLLGGSGCGKTTLLRLIAGFSAPSQGSIVIDGHDMTNTPPYQRPVNMMFQSYALFPHMNVFKNIAYGLKKEGVAKAEIKERVEDALHLVQLFPFAGRKPHQLSGGQRQRVALARALVKRPKALLLDEPLAALDKKLREQTQYELMNIQYKVGITFIVVTHDQEEAMALSTRIAVMDRGQVRQVGRPTEIYEYPNSRFTAGFIGSMTIFDGHILDCRDGQILVRSPELPNGLLVSYAGAPLPAGTPVGVAIRPEKISVSPLSTSSAPNTISAKVRDLGYFGGVTAYRMVTDSGKVVAVNMTNSGRELNRRTDWDAEVSLSWRPDCAILLTE